MSDKYYITYGNTPLINLGKPLTIIHTKRYHNGKEINPWPIVRFPYSQISEKQAQAICDLLNNWENKDE